MYIENIALIFYCKIRLVQYLLNVSTMVAYFCHPDNFSRDKLSRPITRYLSRQVDLILRLCRLATIINSTSRNNDLSILT